MKTCTTCGAAMRPDELTCPTCGSGAASDPYAPGEALVSETLADDPPPSLPTSEEYDVKLQLEAVISKAFHLWAGALGRLVLSQLAIVVVTLPFVVTLIWIIATEDFNLDSFPGWAMALIALTFLVAFPVGFATQAAAYLILENQARGGEPRLSAYTALRQAWRFIPRMMLAYLGLMTMFALAFVPFSVLLGLKLWWVAALVLLPTIILLFYLWIWLTPLFPVLVVEDKGVGAAARRSSQLLLGCKWKVLGYNLMSWLVIMTLAGTLGLVGFIPVFGQIVTLASNLFLTPLWYAIFFSIYAALSDRHRTSTRSR